MANWDNLGKNMSVPDVTVPDVTICPPGIEPRIHVLSYEILKT